MVNLKLIQETYKINMNPSGNILIIEERKISIVKV